MFRPKLFGFLVWLLVGAGGCRVLGCWFLGGLFWFFTVTQAGVQKLLMLTSERNLQRCNNILGQFVLWELKFHSKVTPLGWYAFLQPPWAHLLPVGKTVYGDAI